jgi:large subunit ribosomal protein L25
MNKISLSVEQRVDTGKGPARRLRATGQVPAVLYGKKTEPRKLSVDAREFRKAMEEGGRNPLLDLKVTENGKVVASRVAVLKERQMRPVDGSLIHLDFHEVLMDEPIEVTVAIEFEGKPVGIDKGGLFQPSTRELRVTCLPDDIPSSIIVDVSGLDIGDSVHVGAITLPTGVSAVQDASLSLASVTAPMKEEAPVEEAAAPEEEKPEPTS